MNIPLVVAGLALSFIGAVTLAGLLVFWIVLIFKRPTPRDVYDLAVSIACLPAGILVIAVASGM